MSPSRSSFSERLGDLSGISVNHGLAYDSVKSTSEEPLVGLSNTLMMLPDLVKKPKSRDLVKVDRCYGTSVLKARALMGP